MSDDQNPTYEVSILYYIYHDPDHDAAAAAAATTYRPDSEDWKSAVLRGPALPALGQAVAGAAGAVVSTISTYPLSLIVTRLQLQRQLRGMRALEKRRKEEGEGKGKGKWKGKRKDEDEDEDADVDYEDVDEGEYKGIIDAARKIYEREGGLPAAGKEKKSPTSSTRDIVSAIVAQKGLTGLWAGYSASLILSLNPALTFLLSQVFKFSLLPRDKRRRPPASATFLFAAISKVIASSLTYPFSMAKTRAQAATSASTSSSAARPPPTILHAIYAIARTEGLAALYAGLSGDVLRGFFSHGIAMLAKDTVYRLVVRTYYLLLVMLRRYPSPEELLARAKARTEEVAEEVRGGAGGLAEKVAGKMGDVKEAVAKGVGMAGGRDAGVTGKTVGGAEVAKRRVVEDVYEDSNATAEMVGEYVEDEAEEWRN
ncbi:mitochondrial carrier protein [Histoplasma capsulatum H143]|uniref:Mitochondrial carrier protein n=1 Tax=Ajellomyces capsulatus (strain H143) TaxID=544712 RepID=C6HK35_AJECH|nr:mitochondrial carrier protein [Histoplasma capsulatum H143]